MVIHGRIKGERCKYKEFVYRVPIQEPVSLQITEEMLSVQDRYINALAGIDMKKVRMPTLRVQEIAHYRFEIDSNKYGQQIVKLFLRPTQYTLAKSDKQVGEWVFTGPDFDMHNYPDKSIDDVFQLNNLLKMSVLY
jgi:hypothetical protein